MENQNNITQAVASGSSYTLFDINHYKSRTSDISFSVEIPEEKAHIVTLAFQGTGTVKIYKNCVFACELAAAEDWVSWSDECLAGEIATYQIDNADGITALDLHENHITGFYVSRKLPLNKLMIYENDLQQLDCSNLTELQFLHMFSNPLCEDEAGVRAVIENLPSRASRAIGSIIFYPWYGLETLIEQTTVTDSEGNANLKYVKYPYYPEEKANFSHPENPHHSWLYDSASNYLLEEGRLYAIVSRGDANGSTNTSDAEEATSNTPDKILCYGAFTANEAEDGTVTYSLQEHTKLNNYHAIRKAAESDALPKNWVFGSAIMYSDDWEKCPWDFRQNHVADMWETAEKGFGLILGTMDSITLVFPGSKYLNVASFQNCCETPGYCDYTAKGTTHQKNFLKGDITHGDCILSVLCGNGADEDAAPDAEISYTIDGNAYTYAGSDSPLRFGYAPLCKLRLLDRQSTPAETEADRTIQILNAFSALTTKDCDTITSSTGYTPFPDATDDQSSDAYEGAEHWRELFTNFSANHILTVSAGNKGDELPYSCDTPTEYMYDALYGTSANAQTGVILTGALNREKQAAPFSQNSPAAKRARFKSQDYMSEYGQGIVAHKNIPVETETGIALTGKTAYVSGTSYASPMLNGMLMLLRNIYAKLPGANVSSFGKISPFMDYVRSNWCNRLEDQMDFAVGCGMPDAFAEPVGTHNFLAEQPLAGYMEPGKIGQPIRFLYDAKAVEPAKSDFTIKYDRQMFAATEQKELFPIRPANEAQTVALCSNSARANLTEGDESFYDRNFYENAITVSAVADDGDLQAISGESIEESYSEPEFTVFLLVDLVPEKLDADWDSNQGNIDTTVYPWFARITDSNYGSMEMEIKNGLSYAGNGGFCFTAKRMEWKLFDPNGTSTGHIPLACALENHFSNHTAAVLAIVNTARGLYTYLNGSQVGYMKKK